MLALPGETIFFNGIFNDESLEKFYKSFTEIEQKGATEVTILINSPGGSVDSLKTMLDMIYNTPMFVTTVVSGTACSCGIALLMAGDYRVAFEGSLLMSHQYSWGASGKHHELHASRKAQDLTYKFMLDHYKLHTGLDEATIKQDLLPAEDVWLDPEEALKYNIIDEIVKPAKEIGSVARNERKKQAKEVKVSEIVNSINDLDVSEAEDVAKSILKAVKEAKELNKPKKQTEKSKKVKKVKKAGRPKKEV